MPKSPTYHMQRAVDLARWGLYAAPNPRVGAVLVRGGRVVGEGWHHRFGGPHAEVNALRQAGPRARGATLYVTLEPCGHQGKTPPCTDALIAAGVRKVVAAVRDPHPCVAGSGLARLRRAGIRVETGLLREAALQVNHAYFSSFRLGRPFVILKAAATLDGKIATAQGRSKWITGEIARAVAHGLRTKADAILVGCRTALKDDPALTVRLKGWDRGDGWPLRVLLDPGLRVPPRARIFRGPQHTLVFTSSRAPRTRWRAIEKAGAEVVPVGRKGHALDLRAVLKVLFRRQVRALLVEGGGAVHASFLEGRLADKVALFLSPKILGGVLAPTWIEGRGFPDPQRCPKVVDLVRAQVGEDLLLTGRIEY